jgi:hypothetical protein
MAEPGLNDEIKDKLCKYVKICFRDIESVNKIVLFTNDIVIDYQTDTNLQSYITKTLDRYKTLYIGFVNIFFVELFEIYSRTHKSPTLDTVIDSQGRGRVEPEKDGINIPKLTIETDITTFLEDMLQYFKQIRGFTSTQIYSDVGYTYTKYSNAILYFLEHNKPENYTQVLEKINAIPYKQPTKDINHYNSLYNNIVYTQVVSIYHPTNLLIAIYRRIYDQIRMEQDLEIYRLQLKKEKTPENPHELSKKIIKLMLNENMESLSAVLEFLQANPEAQTTYFGKAFVSLVNVASIDNILAEDTTPKPAKIQIPQLDHKDISQPTLTKLIGLCNPDLYNLLHNAELGPVAFNKKNYFGFDNDLRFKTRMAVQHKFICKKQITAIPPELESLASNLIYVDDENAVDQTIRDIITKCIADGYHLDYYLDKQDNKYTILFTRNSICDIDFSQQEIDTFKTTLAGAIRQGKRYFFTYGSTVGFAEPGFLDKLHGNSKVSLIIDTLKHQIFFFKPMGLDTYAFYNIHTGGLDNMIYYLLPIYLMLNIDSLAGYTFIVDANISPQYIEFNLENAGIGDPATAIKRANFSSIFQGHKPEFQDWSFGYCGLWNYLYIFLLVINPTLDISNIYSFLKALSAQQHNEHLIKLLIRNFAAHIEQALITKYAIPTQSLKLDQLTASTTLGKLRVNSHESHNIQLRTLTADNIAKVKPGTKNIKDTHPILKGEVPRNPLEIYKIIKGYSAYIFANGKHILYDTDLIQFINLDDS